VFVLEVDESVPEVPAVELSDSGPIVPAAVPEVGSRASSSWVRLRSACMVMLLRPELGELEEVALPLELSLPLVTEE